VITLPLRYSTDVLNQSQLWFLASRLPQPCKKEGRKAYTNIELLPGILQVLRSGCRWRDLDFRRRRAEASSVTHWRRLQFWKKSEYFPKLWNVILTRLRESHKLNVQLLSIDGTVIPSYHFRDCTGYSGAKKKHGVNVASIVDSSGLPMRFSVAPGNTIDLTMAQPTLNKIPISFLFKSTILADRGYDARVFRVYLHEKCIKANIPFRRVNQNKYLFDPIFSPFDQDIGRKRYVVERTNAWYKSFRRLMFRFDRTIRSFEAFLYLAALVICLKRLL
jgi:transposase